MNDLLPMRSAILEADGGERIPLQVARHEDRLLLECWEPGRFLALVCARPGPHALPPDTYLRGVVIPGEGAIFQLLDPLGVVVEEAGRLNCHQADRLVLDRIR